MPKTLSKYVVESMDAHTSNGPSDLHKVTNAGSRFNKVSAEKVRAALLRHCETSKQQLESLKSSE